jgi:hypothetical protein
MNLGVSTHGTEQGTYLFLSPGGDVGRGAGIYRDDGTLVWWLHPGPPIVHNLTLVHFHDHPYLALFVGLRRHQHNYGSVWLYNQNYKRVGIVGPGGRYRNDGADLHEFRVTPQGDALIATDPMETVNFNGHPTKVYDYVVQEVRLVHDASGIHTGRVLFQWSALRHVPLSQSHVPPPSKPRLWDWFHGNSISQDKDGNLLISSRNTWGIYKVNVKTGRIIWEVGARGDDTLPAHWCYQHDVVPLGHDRYSLFDDGGAAPGCVEGATAHPSRGLVIQVDPSRRPAGVRLVQAYPHQPAIYAGICGSTQRLGDGNALIDWGDVPELTEYSGDGGRLMDLSLTDWSYRAFRFPWVGKPRTVPALAAQRTSGGMTLWASWNGSTKVVAWRVLAGRGTAELIPVSGAKRKTGFETTITLSQSFSHVAVQALSASGMVLATSAPVTPS